MSEVAFAGDAGSPAEVSAAAEESAKVEAARAELTTKRPVSKGKAMA